MATGALTPDEVTFRVAMTRAPFVSALLAAISIAVQTSPAHAQETAPAPAAAPPAASEDATVATTPATTAQEPTQPAYAAPTPEPKHKSRAARDVGWISLGVGATAAVAAIATSIVMLHDKSVRDSNCDAQKVCNTTGYGAATQLDSLVVFNSVAWAVAAAGVGVGLVLVLTNPSDDSKQTALVVSPNGAGAGLSLRSAF